MKYLRKHPLHRHTLWVLTLLIIGVADCHLLATEPVATRAFVPGDRWLDTEGNFINAHGGGILFHDGTYYWYGELKEGRTYVTAANKAWGGTRVVAGGVSCYSSKNLYDWKREGIALPANPRDPSHDLHSEKVIERPKVIYNARTKKFVMWLHQDESNYSGARSGVAASDTPTGPFKYLSSFRPNAGLWPANVKPEDKVPGTNNYLERDFKGGQMARDMTLFVDDDGTAYQFYSSEENATMHLSQLTEDYLRPSGKYARLFVGRSMEAPAVFKRNSKYYFIASGCTAWEPNAARSAVADNIWGPWTELGNPCRGVDADKTFFGQSTFVLQVQGKPDTYIAMFDRWKQWDLADSRYLWLPVRFEGDKFTVPWQERWSWDRASEPQTASVNR
jgi:hypothetical protein